ncbi:hypothetical protein KIN20_015216 [Parelaphostrongylus tenuis]|uniref:Uncharacterized protein n=1 Tax=Parelaphostrongylus tenuis TaxID=148309 RepID=A0AAD5MEJ9_PARTN|nr:hypothetical protein KIN20_015216 [Parelaphostrongylus tenuis]
METRGVVLDVAEEMRVEVKITALPSDFKVVRSSALNLIRRSYEDPHRKNVWL